MKRAKVVMMLGAMGLALAAMMALSMPTRTLAIDPTLDAAQMTFEAARVQATIRARATADAQWATRAAIQQTVAVVAIQQTQAAAEQLRVAQETRAALEAQATRQALELTATAQHYEQSINATGTAVAINATQQAVEASATRNTMSAQATRQALDEQAALEQRKQVQTGLITLGTLVLIGCVTSLVVAVWLTLRQHQRGTLGAKVPAVVVPVPQTRVLQGDAAEQGARLIASLLEQQGEYDDEPDLDTN